MWIVLVFLIMSGVGCATDDGTGLRCDAPVKTAQVQPLILADNDH